MTLPIAIVIYTDAVRLWGALAGLLCWYDVAAWLRDWRTMHAVKFAYTHPFTRIFVKAGLALFLVCAGIVIPFSDRILWLPSEGMVFGADMAVAWTAISSTGWALVVDRSANPVLMRRLACVLLLGLIGISILQGAK